MPNKLQREEPKDKMEMAESESLDNLIRDQVIQALGEPFDLRNVQVRKVTKEHYRVNVIVGMNAASVRVANSYFVQIGSDGHLIAATPQITKQY